jgi:hypothetical protein
MGFVNFKDPKVPLGKRKQAFVKWRISCGDSIGEAKLFCGRYFYHEIKSEAWDEHSKDLDKFNKTGKCPSCGQPTDSIYDRGLDGIECTHCK